MNMYASVNGYLKTKSKRIVNN